MAERNTVPTSVSMPIPGFDEARAAWNEQYAREEKRRRAINSDRWSYFRSQFNDRSSQARLMSDLNPLVVAGEMYTGELASAGLKAVGKTVFSGGMRPGYIRFPTGKPVSSAARVQFMDLGFSGTSTGEGGVTLNQTIADALKPRRVMLEQTVDRTLGARYGGITYSPIGGGETSALNPGLIVRHRLSPWNSLTAARIRGLAPSPIEPASPTVFRMGASGRTVTERMISEFNSAVPPPSVAESAWTAPQPVLDELTSKYTAAQETIRKIYSDKDAVKALNSAFRNGNMDDPVMKMYQSAKERYSASRAALERYAKAYEKGSTAAARSPTRQPFSQMLNEQNLAHSREIARRLTGKKTFAENARSIKPGTLFSDHIVPWIKDHPFKTAAWTSVFALPTAAWTISGSEKNVQDGKTIEVNQKLDPIKQRYLAITNDASVSSAMSDSALLRRMLFDLRDTAAADMTADPNRAPAVRAVLSDYANRIGQSPAMQELMSRSEDEYRGISQSDDFRQEYRSRYPDVFSRALGTDFYGGVLGGAR